MPVMNYQTLSNNGCQRINKILNKHQKFMTTTSIVKLNKHFQKTLINSNEILISVHSG